MTLLLAVTAVVALLVLGVVWSCLRIASEISRFEDWDHTVVRQKRERWR